MSETRRGSVREKAVATARLTSGQCADVANLPRTRDRRRFVRRIHPWQSVIVGSGLTLKAEVLALDAAVGPDRRTVLASDGNWCAIALMKRSAPVSGSPPRPASPPPCRTIIRRCHAVPDDLDGAVLLRAPAAGARRVGAAAASLRHDLSREARNRLLLRRALAGHAPSRMGYQEPETMTLPSFRAPGIARRVAHGRQRRRHAEQRLRPTVILYRPLYETFWRDAAPCA
jgi:hypothetical protein